MLVYRLTPKQYQKQILSGVGAEKVGGRWNEIGTRAVYCSENISLCLLEYYVNTEDIAALPKDILVAKIQIPEEFPIYQPNNLPQSWAEYPYTMESAAIFTALVEDPNFFALKVPSSVVPSEFNYVLNPLYKGFGKVKILEYVQLPVDPRLTKR
jgi:RES domain-containing protein